MSDDDDRGGRLFRAAFPNLAPIAGTRFATDTDAKIAHDLWIAKEWLRVLSDVSQQYERVRTETAAGQFSATMRFCVLVARQMGMTEREFFAIARACWGDR